MPANYTPGNPFDSQRGMQIIISNLEAMKEAIVDVKYSDIFWPQHIPTASIDTSINPGASYASYRVRDRRGKGTFRAKNTNNVPVVGQTIDKVSVNLENSGVSAVFDNQDVREYNLGYYGGNLTTEYTKYMREASERHIEGVFFFGDANVDYKGFINAPLVPVTTAINGAGGSSLWINKTADEIIKDVNDGLATVWKNSELRHLPSRVVLPPEQYGLIAGTKAGIQGNDWTILRYIQENNIFTNMTGRPLEVLPLIYLTGAGTAPADSDRMRIVTFEEENFWMPMPLPFEFLDPQQVDFGVKLLAEYIFASVHIRFPISQLNVDGI